MDTPENSRLISSVNIMIQVGLEHGLDIEQCLSGTKLTADHLEDERTLVTSKQEIQVIENLVTGLPAVEGLGLIAGLRYQLTTFGIWAFAIISSPNLRAAFQVAARFAGLSFVLINFSLEDHENESVLVMDAGNLPKHLHQFAIERHLAILLSFIGEMFGLDKLAPKKISLALPVLAFDLLPVEIAHESIVLKANRNCVIFDNDALTLTSPKANTATAEFCIQQCQEQLDKRVAQSGFSGQVRRLILANINNIPTLERSAKHFNMSARTFRRRLEEDGNSYRNIVEKTREGIAIELLDTAKLSVDAVAERLGYAEPSSFIHAFKRWTGTTPAQHRKKRLA
ncbi:MAG: AraC family transcriptional regulator ligand-binding domain-containing protein [Pseudomonadota bacterium]